MIDAAMLIKTMMATRGYFIQNVADLSEEQMLQVPPGTGHNILWNLGHIVYSNTKLLYGPCGLDAPVPAEYESMYKGGTSPGGWDSMPNVQDVLTQLKESNNTIVADYQAGKIAQYQSIELAKGYALESAEEAFAFNLMHEGTHIGMVMELRKLVGAGTHA